MADAPPARLPRRLLLGYGAPALPIAMLTGPVFTALPTYYVAELGLPQAAVGVALLVSRIWDALCDPMVGVLGDRVRSRFGRRRPLMLAGVPLILLASLFLFVLAPSLSPLMIGVWSAVLYTGWTLMKLSHDAWGAELSPDYGERVRVTATREGYALVGGLAVILLVGWGTLPGGPGLGGTFTVLFWVLVGLFAVTLPLALLRTPDPPLPVGHVAPTFNLRTLLANRPLRQLSITFFVNGLANAFPATLFLLFVEHVLGRPDLRGPLILLYFICAVAAVPLWTWAGRRWGKHRAWIGSMLISVMFFAPVAFFREGFEIWFAIVCVVTGVCYAGDTVLPPAIQADVLDEDRLATGEERAGLLFAWLGLLSKLTFAFGVGIAFPVMEAIGFNPQEGAVNTASAIAGVALLYALVPTVLKLGACWALKGFPLDARRQADIRAALAARASTA